MNLGGWMATGWRGHTVLQYSRYLPGGIYGLLYRSGLNARWSYRTGGMDSRRGQYAHRWTAQKACEEQLRHECREALRLLRKPK